MYEKIVNWYLSCRAVPYWYILLTDCCIVLFSGIVGYTVNHGLPSTSGQLKTCSCRLCLSALLSCRFPPVPYIQRHNPADYC